MSVSFQRSDTFWCGQPRLKAKTSFLYRTRITSLSRSIVAPSAAGTGYDRSLCPPMADDSTLAEALRIGRLSEIAPRARAAALRRKSLRSGMSGQPSQSACASGFIGSDVVILDIHWMLFKLCQEA